MEKREIVDEKEGLKVDTDNTFHIIELSRSRRGEGAGKERGGGVG